MVTSADPDRLAPALADQATGLTLLPIAAADAEPQPILFSLDEDGVRRLTEAHVELYGSSYLLVVGAAGHDILIHDLDNQTDVRFELGRSSPLADVSFVPKADQR